MDGMLSQEEINALLAGDDKGGGNNDSSAADTTSPADDGQFECIICKLGRVIRFI